MEFIALGVFAEIIMIFQNKNLRAFACALAREMRSSQAADSPAHNNQVIFFSKLFGSRRVFPECSVTQAVGNFKRSWMASAEASRNGRIVAGLILRLLDVFPFRAKRSWQQRRPNGHRRAVQKVPARNITVHSKFPVRAVARIFLVHIVCAFSFQPMKINYAVCNSSTAR